MLRLKGKQCEPLHGNNKKASRRKKEPDLTIVEKPNKMYMYVKIICEAKEKRHERGCCRTGAGPTML